MDTDSTQKITGKWFYQMNTKTASIYKSAAGKEEIMALYDRVLERWAVPYETLHVPTRHGNTFIIASGEKTAPVLVLLHGSTSNATSWVADVAEYSQYFRVYALDLPGEPGRSDENRPSWSGPAFAEWLEDVLDVLKVEKTNLVGISQGGWAALKFATQNPERVEKLVLLTPGGVVPVSAWFLLRAIPLSLLGRFGAKIINDIVFGRQKIEKEALEIMNTIMVNFKPRIENPSLYTDAELRRLSMPVLLVAGLEDAMIPAKKSAGRLKALLPALTVKLIPETGHVLHNTAGQVTPFLLS